MIGGRAYGGGLSHMNCGRRPMINRAIMAEIDGRDPAERELTA